MSSYFKFLEAFGRMIKKTTKPYERETIRFLYRDNEAIRIYLDVGEQIFILPMEYLENLKLFLYE